MSDKLFKGNRHHTENDYNDFNRENLLPKMISTEGPKLAIGDLNGDGLEDFFEGNAFADTAKIFLARPDGTYQQKAQPAFTADKYFESIGAAFSDIDGDGDLDLVVCSGGNQSWLGYTSIPVRLYLNDGKGNFSRSNKGWPSVAVNGSCVTPLDFDGDGRVDFFIGGRVVPGQYGLKPASVLLKNEGKGIFKDVTKTDAPGLVNLGMVTDAAWVDFKKDRKPVLVVVGDWMPVTGFQYLQGKFQKLFEIPHSAGWWNSLTVADLNQDGFPDLITGNFGLNSRIKADSAHPAKLITGDFNHNGKTTCVPVYYKSDGKAYPYWMKGEIEKEIPGLKKKFLHFKSYAGKEISDVLSPDDLSQSTILTAEETRSAVFFNDGKGGFTIQPLPIQAQLSPVYTSVVSDFNNDGIPDIFLAGNFYGLKPQTGRFDASYGTTLLGDAQHHFHYLQPKESGLFVRGEVRDAKMLKAGTRTPLLLVARNNDDMIIFKSIK